MIFACPGAGGIISWAKRHMAYGAEFIDYGIDVFRGIGVVYSFLISILRTHSY
jgi:hypothetical protein